MRAERRAKVDPGGKKLSIESEWGISTGIDYAERSEKMHTGKQGAIVEESGKAPGCVSLGRRRLRVRRFDACLKRSSIEVFDPCSRTNEFRKCSENRQGSGVDSATFSRMRHPPQKFADIGLFGPMIASVRRFRTRTLSHRDEAQELHHITDEPWDSSELIGGFSRARSHCDDHVRRDIKRRNWAVPEWKEHQIQPY
jgi:hypothetical protein